MPLDDADKKFMAEFFANALKARDEENGKALDAQIGKAVKAAVDKVAKDLNEFKTSTEERLKKPEDKPEDKKASGNATGDIDSPALKKALAELEAANKRAEENARRAEEQERKSNADRLRSALTDALLSNGADPARVRLAVTALISDGVVALNDKGEPTFTIERKYGPDALPVKDGAKEWLTTAEGKGFVPAVATEGTGTKVATGTVAPPKTKDGATDWAALGKRVRPAALAEALSGDNS